MGQGIVLYPKRKERGFVQAIGSQVESIINQITNTTIQQISTEPSRVMSVNDARAVLTLDQHGTGPLLDLNSATPELRFTEDDQTDPAGRIRFFLSADTFFLQEAASASWATTTNIFAYGGSPKNLAFTPSVDIGTLLVDILRPDSTAAGDSTDFKVYVGASLRTALSCANVTSGNIPITLGEAGYAVNLAAADNLNFRTRASSGYTIQIQAHNGTDFTQAIRIENANPIEIGFFDSVGQGQSSHIIDADGTLPDITTKFNTLLANLEGYGLLKSS